PGGAPVRAAPEPMQRLRCETLGMQRMGEQREEVRRGRLRRADVGPGLAAVPGTVDAAVGGDRENGAGRTRRNRQILDERIGQTAEHGGPGLSTVAAAEDARAIPDRKIDELRILGCDRHRRQEGDGKLRSDARPGGPAVAAAEEAPADREVGWSTETPTGGEPGRPGTEGTVRHPSVSGCRRGGQGEKQDHDQNPKRRESQGRLLATRAVIASSYQDRQPQAITMAPRTISEPPTQ